MANISLLVDPEEMRAVARSVGELTEDFEVCRTDLKRAIGEELETACSGDVAQEFTRYYNENIDTKLVEEKARLDGVVSTLNSSAQGFEDTASAVKASF